MTAEPTGLGRSPLAHLADTFASTGAERTVRLRELPFLAQIELRVDPDGPAAARAGDYLGTGLPAGPADVRSDGPRCVLWCGPGWYLVVDEPGAQADLEAGLRTALDGTFGAVVDVSAQRTVLELTGPHARAVLQHGCSLDLHPRAFTTGCCAQTALAKAQIILHQTAPTPAYRILVRASFADYLARWLLDAMVEYVGPGDPGCWEACP